MAATCECEWPHLITKQNKISPLQYPHLCFRVILFTVAIETIAMAVYGSLWSCTSTELAAPVTSTNTTLDLRVGGSPHCDLTLLTCLLIGSYRFCIIPLLAAFHAKPQTQQWASKWREGRETTVLCGVWRTIFACLCAPLPTAQFFVSGV